MNEILKEDSFGKENIEDNDNPARNDILGSKHIIVLIEDKTNENDFDTSVEMKSKILYSDLGPHWQLSKEDNDSDDVVLSSEYWQSKCVQKINIRLIWQVIYRLISISAPSNSDEY